MKSYQIPPKARDLVGSVQEHRHPHHICDLRPVVGDVVEAIDVDAFSSAAAHLDRNGGCTAVDAADPASRLAPAHTGGSKAAAVGSVELGARMRGAGVHQRSLCL